MQRERAAGASSLAGDGPAGAIGAAASADVIVTSGSRAGVVASGTGVGAGVGVVAGTFFCGEKTFSTVDAMRSRIGERGVTLALAGGAVVFSLSTTSRG